MPKAGLIFQLSSKAGSRLSGKEMLIPTKQVGNGLAMLTPRSFAYSSRGSRAEQIPAECNSEQECPFKLATRNSSITKIQIYIFTLSSVREPEQQLRTAPLNALRVLDRQPYCEMLCRQPDGSWPRYYDCPLDNSLFSVFKAINGEQFKSAVRNLKGL